ncbi:MarR family transcriptional regulator [Streptomyces sp. NE06-03E]|uniref:MarR family transcriptional regulator n=2 Tax=Streptomyces TaxID=1883 RepID=A0A652KPY4_9ACTN|nr:MULTISPECIES: MarR family transcriptional regulator [unclassified Streptomyces]WSS60217.1 MarR family transcriptional regulator [Streptomyces sp. NBC_01177]WSS67326.1 MarR family transcriptional regulator [Streptomyces sp. NBC_01175]WSS74242.1 MarR family transcriptional regulator [Streptomyces sp. NBC_01174]MDX3056638.1 MarR family transcriptional regulator [Streptomyces sp. NE06-03E]MDX3326284.1 MarR family transcriptional regulator [Streptomyces sp. ME02-6979-3A]
MAAKKSEQALVGEWRAMLALHARTLGELDRALGPHGLGASDFEVLDVLTEAAGERGEGCLRVQEIASRVHLSQSALSRLVARLERDGLVRRVMCDEDRRGVRVELTDTGRARHTEARPLQRAVLSRMLDRAGK